MVELHDYEHLLRELYASGGRLAIAAAEAQATEHMSPTTGHQVLSSFSNAQVAVSGALAHVADGHRFLETLGRKLGYDVESFGDETKPPRNPFAVEADRLRIAA